LSGLEATAAACLWKSVLDFFNEKKMLIQSVKNSIWDCIKDKEVALFMIFSDKGEILYYRRRHVKGRTIGEGRGFCCSHCLEILNMRREIAAEDCLVSLNGNCISDSAMILKIKQLLIFPVSAELFFYLDSGNTEPFLEKEIVELRALGKVFSRLIKEIKKSERVAEGITGRSREADRIRSLVRKYAIVEEPVLLLGETGVGKNRVAELIHRYSGKKGDFVSVHAPGVAKELFESQLFGHRKGSFTGAIEDTIGFVSKAAGGTLFFDEISELPLAGQAKLLRLIDIKSFTRLGDAVERRADVRIIAATNKDLRDLIAKKLFREDLYFRLNVLPIFIPPLRERRMDIPDLLSESSDRLRGKKLNKEAVSVLGNYSWPGNIRELHTILTRAGVNSVGDEIGAEIAEFFEKDFPTQTSAAGNGKLDGIWQELKEGKTFWEAVKDPFMKRDICREDVKVIVQRASKESLGKGYMKDCLPILNIPPQEFKKYLDFIRDYHVL
jgi:DNA-binding NtrC family response regulator